MIYKKYQVNSNQSPFHVEKTNRLQNYNFQNCKRVNFDFKFSIKIFRELNFGQKFN